MKHTLAEYWQALIKMSLTQLYMLQALRSEPAHGYDLARRVQLLSNGTCTPTEGTIYPVLREWEQEGLVAGEWEVKQGRRRRIYRLTEAGRTALEAGCTAWIPAAEAVCRLSPSVTDRLDDHLL